MAKEYATRYRELVAEAQAEARFLEKASAKYREAFRRLTGHDLV